MTERLRQCPFCGGDVVPHLSCTSCFATLQDRITWTLVTKLKLIRPGSRVLHHSPSIAIARRLFALIGRGYHASLPPGVSPAANDVSFYNFDLANDAGSLQESYYDLIIVGQGLSDAGTAFFSTLDALAAALVPGGSMLFGGDVVDEDGSIADPALDRFVHGNGPKRSFASLVRSKFGRTCRVRAGEEIDTDYVEAMGVPIARMRRVSPDLLFWYQS